MLLFFHTIIAKTLYPITPIAYQFVNRGVAKKELLTPAGHHPHPHPRRRNHVRTRRRPRRNQGIHQRPPRVRMQRNNIPPSGRVQGGEAVPPRYSGHER